MFKVKVEDIQSFLEQKGYFWNGELGEGITFDQNDFCSTIRKPVCLGDLQCGITPFKFIVYGLNNSVEKQKIKDWSKGWINNLINTRGQEYIPYVKKWCASQKCLIIADNMKKENLFLRIIEKIRKEEQEQLKEITALEKKIYSADSSHTY